VALRLATERYFCYACGPIDWWDGWQSVPEFIAAEGDSEDPDTAVDKGNAAWHQGVKARRIAEVGSLLQTLGRQLAEELRWEGDGLWRIASLPEPKNFACVAMLAVKQQNNGLTFICSPYPLGWLETASLSWKEIDLWRGAPVA
jgi:hypothetical protein